MHKFKNLSVLVLSSFFLVAVAMLIPAYAREHINPVFEKNKELVTTANNTSEYISSIPNRQVSPVEKGKALRQEKQALRQQRLSEVRLKVCQQKENNIKNRASHLEQLVNNMELKFDEITQRVETYYTNKVAANGKTVSNYNTLVANIQTEKTTVATALAKAKNDVSGFTCTGDNPKGQLTLYRQDMQTVKQALKSYRTAIKNLIVAVHSVAKNTEKKVSKTPEPSGGE